MIRFKCPTCGKMLKGPEGWVGGKVACPNCKQQLLIPIPVQGVLHSEAGAEGESHTRKRADEKFCHECGAAIRAKAEICPKCGVRQSNLADGLNEPNRLRNGVKVPILVSAIANIVMGLVWFSTCIGIV